MGEIGAGAPRGESRAVLRAFLISDIRGFSSFAAARGEEATAALARRFIATAAAVLPEHGGEVVGSAGDSVLAAFESPRRAIRGALAFQAELLAATREDPSLPMPAGVGLDFGEGLQTGEEWTANAINVAARLCAIANGGEILATEQIAHVAQALDGVTYSARNPIAVKGIAQPVRHVRVVADGRDVARGFRDLGLTRAAPLPQASRGRRSLVVAIAVAAIAVAGAVVGIAELGGHGGQIAAPIGANAVGALSANGGRLHRRVAVGGAPGAIAADDAEVWVVNTADDTVSRIDARNASASANTISVGHDPTAVAIGAGSVWVTNGSDRSVSRINPGAAPSVGDTIAVGNAPSSVTVGLGEVWVTNAIDGTMTEIDPGGGARPPDRVRATIGVGAQPSAVTTGFGSVWVANAGSSNVFRIDPGTRSVVASISVGNGPQAITADPGGIWVANTLDNTASRIDPRSNSVVATVLVGRKPSGTTSTGPDVWVTNSDSDTVTQIDAKTNEVVRTVRVGNAPQATAASGADVWVSAHGSAALHRGGTLRIVASDENVNSLDPAIAYRQFAFGVLATTNDGLVTFNRTAGPAGATIVPDLATQLPAPSDSGRTYTFQLRKGIRYSTGEPVVASDFPASLERAFRLKNLPPYYDAIEGGAACAKRPLGCDLSRGIETNDRTGGIAIHLTHADPELLYKLALPFAALLPKGTPARDLGVSPHAGTGPYVITSGTPKRVVLTRNPQFAQWSSTAQPDGYPDRIEISLSASAKQDPTPADIAAVARGRFDYTPDAMPADLLDRLVRTQTGQLHPYTQNTLRYEFLNTNIPPLDDARVRRAINLAVDRRAAVAALGGPLLATPTCQQVPPSLFGYRPYCPYTATPDAGGRWTAPDLAAARTLVRSAFTPGTPVEIVSIPGDRPVAGVIARAMQAIGLRPRLKILHTDSQGYFAYVSNPRNRARAGLEGWSVDYPEPSNLLAQLLRCNAIAQPQSLNQAGFCDPRIDRRMDAALRLQTSDPAAAGALWAEIDRTITNAAPWVPLAVDRQYDVVSRRIGNYEHHPQFGVLIDQAWVR